MDGPLPGSPQGLAVSVTVTAKSEGPRRTQRQEQEGSSQTRGAVAWAYR